MFIVFFFFFQAEDGIRDLTVTGVQTCALPICSNTLRPQERSGSRRRAHRRRTGGHCELVTMAGGGRVGRRDRRPASAWHPELALRLNGVPHATRAGGRPPIGLSSLGPTDEGSRRGRQAEAGILKRHLPQMGLVPETVPDFEKTKGAPDPGSALPWSADPRCLSPLTS